MQTPRHIGIDLHRNQFTCCVRLENGRNYLREWKLEDLPRFVKKLRPDDEIAVEVTGNTRMKDKTQAQLASLTQTRDTLVKLRTALKNKINNILSAHGINLAKVQRQNRSEFAAWCGLPLVGPELLEKFGVDKPS